MSYSHGYKEARQTVGAWLWNAVLSRNQEAWSIRGSRGRPRGSSPASRAGARWIERCARSVGAAPRSMPTRRAGCAKLRRWRFGTRWVLSRPQKKKRNEFLERLGETMRRKLYMPVAKMVKQVVNPRVRGWVNY